MESFVFTLDTKKRAPLYAYLNENKFEFTHPPYTDFAAKKKGISLTLYLSGKCVVQGKESKDFIEFYLEPEILGSFERSYPLATSALIDKHPHIGVDESGKGDFFGPLVIAGVYATTDQIDKLLEIGVKDSKTLSEHQIHLLAKKIKAVCDHQIVI